MHLRNLNSIFPKARDCSLIFIIFFIIINTDARAQLVTADSSATSVTLQWTAPGDDGDNGTAYEYDIRYSTSMIDQNNWNSAIQVIGEPYPQPSGSAESFTVEDLEPGTTYYFAIKAADEAYNWSSLSNVAVKTTANEQIPPADVTDLLASNPTTSSITLTWTAPGDDGNEGTASEYDIRYATSSINNGTWAQATQIDYEPSPLPAGSEQSVVISDLSENTTYYFALKTADEVPQWSGLSNIASMATLEDIDQTPPGGIVDAAITEIVGGSITLTWTAPGDDGYEGTASVYDIRYNTEFIDNYSWSSSTPADNEPEPRPAGSQEIFTVTGLNLGTIYFFAIRAYDEVPNYSVLSNIVSGTTENEQDPPEAITSLQVFEANQNSVTLTWIAPGDDGDQGQASIYDIRYSTSPINEFNWNSASQVSGEPSPAPAGSAETFVVDGLQSESQYYFAIKTADEVPNWSVMSNLVNAFTPDQTPPAAIGDLSAVTGDDIGTVAIQWTAPGDDSLSGTAEYIVIKTYSEIITDDNWDFAQTVSDPPTPLESGSLHYYVIGGLNPGQYYHVAVKTADDYGNVSAISNPASAEARPFGTDGINDLVNLPEEFNLGQNYPNPFNPTTNIVISLPEPAHIILDIYDSSGRKVVNLANEYYEAGYHTVTWDGHRNDGTRASTGVYFYTMAAGTYLNTRKMIVLK